MNRKITFLKKEKIKDSMGQTKHEYQPYKTVWATVKPIKSTEVNFIGKLKPDVTHRLYIRYREDITADMRIQIGKRVFSLAGPPIDLNDTHELLEIQAEEVFERKEY